MVEDRHQKILGFLAHTDQVSVVELSEQFDVSLVTIRTDLNQLAEQGKVIRTHGGARLAGERQRQELTYATRQRINAEEKMCIGVEAASMVTSNEAILLDSSTTAVAVGSALKSRNDLIDITVVTTGIWTALELLGTSGVQVVLAGGQVRDTTGSITGKFTEDILMSFNFSKVFLGAWGIELREGVTDTHLTEVELKQKIVTRSDSVYIVVDGSKFGRKGLSSYASLKQIDGIITDKSAPEQYLQDLRDKGLDVKIAST